MSSSRPENSRRPPAASTVARLTAMSSTTLLSSTSRIHDRAQHGGSVGQRFEYSIGIEVRELFDGIPAGCYSDSSRADRFTALNIGGSIANDDQPVSLDLASKKLAGATLRYGRQ